MFDKVIIGVDGREGGHDAVELGRRLAADHAAITFAHIYGMPTANRVSASALLHEREAAKRLLSEEVRRTGLVAVPAAVHNWSAARGLHTIVEQRRAELLVVGSCHRGLLGRTLLGDDTCRILDGAPCAVAIAPRAYAAASGSARLARIGVGCDASLESEWALEVGRELAARHEAKVKALAVVSLQSIPHGEPIPDQWEKLADRLVVDERHRLDRLKGVEGDATYGDPGEELAIFSGDLDLLIVGSRSYGPIGRLFAGSTSRYLLRHTRCPLLVLPRSAGHETAARANKRQTVRAQATSS
jgi:nucleotide-binding universal stress UspA family protein